MKLNTPVSCVDCAHHRSRKATFNKTYTLHECAGVRDRVTGAVVIMACHTVAGRGGACGPKGALFTAKVPGLEAAE